MRRNAPALWLLAVMLLAGGTTAFGQVSGRSLVTVRNDAPPAAERVANPDSALPTGVYDVGRTGHFPTIDSAFNKLERDGVTGSVTLTLIDTLYRAERGRRFDIGPIAGTGPLARVTIRPAVNTRVTIRGDSDAVVYLQGAKYVTIDGRSNPPSQNAGLTVHALFNSAAAWNDCIDGWGDADFNQFLYLTLVSDDFRNVAPGGGGGIVLGNIGAAVPDSNLVEGNQISSVFGILFSGLANSWHARHHGNIIRGNTYGKPGDLHGAWGIQSEYGDGTLIEGNTVRYLNGLFANSDGFWSIGINAYGEMNSTLRNNAVHTMSTSSGAMLFALGATGGTAELGSGVRIYNNMVYDLRNSSTGGNAYIRGIALWYNTNALVAYNTVHLSGTGPNVNGVDALRFGSSTYNLMIRNNILINTYLPTTPVYTTALCMQGDRNVYVFSCDFNDVYVDTTNMWAQTGYLLGYGYSRTLPDWQARGYDQHGVSMMPVFSTPHLHIGNNPANRQIDGSAMPLAGITTDFDGTNRNPTNPDIGADEFTLTSVGEHGALPEAFALGQNYPNPFNPSTSIEYQVPRTGRVTLTVYDMLGREVRTLVDGIEEPGYRLVRFDASSLASGIYLCRLRAEAFTQTIKMLLVR